jgi:hypothetical protein
MKRIKDILNFLYLFIVTIHRHRLKQVVIKRNQPMLQKGKVANMLDIFQL